MRFYKGEKKEVTIEITSTRGDAFLIRDATYELLKVIDNTVEASGEASIDGKQITVLVEPQQTGTYILYITYEIAAERLKAPVSIEVE